MNQSRIESPQSTTPEADISITYFGDPSEGNNDLSSVVIFNKPLELPPFSVIIDVNTNDTGHDIYEKTTEACLDNAVPGAAAIPLIHQLGSIAGEFTVAASDNSLTFTGTLDRRVVETIASDMYKRSNWSLFKQIINKLVRLDDPSMQIIFDRQSK